MRYLFDIFNANFIPRFAGKADPSDNLLLTQKIKGMFKIPTDFSLGGYPFGKQSCQFSISLKTSSESVHLEREEYNDKWHNIYERAPTVGEFKIKDMYIYLYDYYYETHEISLYIYFAPIYSYYILNTFLTSFLIVLISFTTFCFKVNYFNERIMVSLTSLLVLSSLFSDSAATLVKTSYLKLIDIWHAALIIITFLNVVANTALHCYSRKLNANVTDKEEEKSQIIANKVSKLNRILSVTVLVIFMIFLTCFLFIILQLTEGF